jgi:hypothetical protein
MSSLYYMLPCRAQCSLVCFKLMIVTFLSDVEILEIMRTRNPPMRVIFFSFTLVAKQIMMMLLLLAIEGETKIWEGEIFSTLGVQFLKNRGSPETNSWRGSSPVCEKKRGGKKIWGGEIFSKLGVQFLKNRGSPETNSWRGSSPMCEKKKKIAIRRKIELYRRETFWICVLQGWSAESVLGVHGDSKS